MADQAAPQDAKSFCCGTTAAIVAGACTVISIIYFAFVRHRSGTRRIMPQNTVLLYQFPRGPFAPNISPFPLKLETFLRMAGIDYMNDFSNTMSSKGKIPWMTYNGVDVADSQFCIEYLKKQRDVDFYSSFSRAEAAAARALQKMTEENLYWTMCYELFVHGGRKTLAKVFPYKGLQLLIHSIIISLVIKLELWGQGIGRHSDEEIWDIAQRDLMALSDYLGDKKFMLGDHPCEADCAIFGMLAMIIFHMPGSRHESYVKSKLHNLVEYAERMRHQFWLDWDKRCTASPYYENDADKLYAGFGKSSNDTFTGAKNF